MAGMTERYDTALLGILQHEGQISGFLDAILGFLYRRTDFYRIMRSKDDNMGFPPGVAVKLLLSAYKKYEDMAKHKELEKEKLMKAVEEPTDTVPPAAVKTVEVTTTEQQTTNKNKSETKVTPCDQHDIGSQGSHVSETKESSKPVAEIKTEQPQTTTTEPKVENSNPNDKDGEEDTVLTKQQQEFQANPASYNGAVRDTYSWSQSITDVDVQAKVPKYITKGKDVKVVIEKKHLKVSHKVDSGQMEDIINGDLTWDVNKEESMWSLVPGEHVHINLEKREERWWEALITTEPKISVRKIDASRPMTDLDDEAQAKIEEMMYNDRQKKLGLPQSHEQKMHEIMKGAWDAEGSPFKGQPFDPSKLSMNQGGVVTINDDKNT